MFFSGVLFDLDNTLYSYKECHDKALSKVLDTIANDYDIPIDILYNYYTNVSNTLKYELTSTSSLVIITSIISKIPNISNFFI